MLLSLTTMAASYIYREGYGLQFAWTAGDRIAITAGIIDGGTTEQLCFRTSSSQGLSANNRSLYATGFSLKDGLQYYSYYPYIWNTAFDATTVSLSYTGQQQLGNGLTEHLSTYDYSSSLATPNNGSCEFAYHHLGTFLRITYIVPVGISGKATLNIKTEANKIPSSATLNLKQQGTSQEVIVSSLTNNFTTSLSGLDSGTSYTAYIAIPAVNLSGEKITLAITTTSGETSLATIKGFNARSGYLYNIDLSTASQSKSKTTTSPYIDEKKATSASVSNPTATSPDILVDPNFSLEICQASIFGDVNNNGKVEITDVTTLIKHLLDGTTSLLDKNVCDINKDGKITILDIKGIADIIIK